MSRHVVAFVLIWMLSLGVAHAGDAAVVLVTASDSGLETIDSLSIRKAYLGVPIQVHGRRILPVRRKDDPRLDEIFMQAVMAMSEKSYERRLLSLSLKFAVPRPVEALNEDQLMKSLTSEPMAISYMWQAEAEADSRIRVIRVLWQEP